MPCRMRCLGVILFLPVVSLSMEACSTSESGASAGAEPGGEQPSGPVGPGQEVSTVHFSVPDKGGTVEVKTRSGETLAFDFPASAAGKDIALTPSDAASIGWTAETFRDVIKMEPDGTQFADPVLVRATT